MAKFGRKTASEGAPERTPNAIVAASQRMMPDKYNNVRIPITDKTSEAWRQWRINGELAAGARWLGSALSRCRLVAVEVDKTGQILGDARDPNAVEILAGFAGNPTRAAQLLRQFGTYMTVPGDAYIVASETSGDGLDYWCVHSTSEVKNVGGSKFQINIGDGNPQTYDANSTLLIRVWRPDPERQYDAESPTMTALPVLKEIEQLSKHIFAVIDSRLAGAGILLLPSELDFPSPGDDIQPGESPFIALLSQAMMASIANRGDARAVVPIVAQAPKEALGGAQWLTSPAADLTPIAADLRDRAIRRLAINLDMPPEALLGSAGASHWAAWQIEEQGIKLYIEPTLMIICEAITTGYFRPALEAAGLDPTKYAVWFDASDLVLRPNQATDAKDLFDRGAISYATLRRACGFSEQDAPQGKEKALRDIEVALKAAPQLGDHIARALISLLELSRYVSEEDLQPIQPDPAGGTPPKDGGGPPLNPDPTAPPVRGSDGGGDGRNGG